MKRAMTIRIIALAAFGVIAASSGASAAVWAWGCQGQLGGQQVIFNRYALAVVDSKKPLGKLDKLTNDKIDDLITGDSVRYEPQNTNDGFERTIEFLHSADPKRKLTLIEKSSRKISSRSKLICGRDESTDITRKVYSYQRENEPAREITMQCIEYQLSTRGGRKGCD